MHSCFPAWMGLGQQGQAKQRGTQSGPHVATLKHTDSATRSSLQECRRDAYKVWPGQNLTTAPQDACSRSVSTQPLLPEGARLQCAAMGCCAASLIAVPARKQTCSGMGREAA